MVLLVDEGACDVNVLNGCNKGLNVQHVNIAVDWRQFRMNNFSGDCSGISVRLDVPDGDIWSEQKAVVVFLQQKTDGRVLGFCRRELFADLLGGQQHFHVCWR